MCDHPNLQKPQPVSLNTKKVGDWDHQSRVGYDCCAVTLDERESQGPGYYMLSGFDPTCLNQNQYSDRLSEIVHFPKQYRNSLCYPDQESDLQFRSLSNLGEINQLFTRPYLGSYMGAGQPSLSCKDTETALFQGVLTNLKEKPCEVTRETSLYRFQHLPEFGNPQREQHIIPPPIGVGGWIRGGAHTRDYVRRVDYQRRCLNKVNEYVVHKKPMC